LENRQREEVEPDVSSEDRIRGAEGDLVDPAKQHVPLVAAREAKEEGRDEEKPHEPQSGRERAAPSALGVDDHARNLRQEREIQGPHRTKPERSMFDQSMFPQSLPPSPPRPRSRILAQDRREVARSRSSLALAT